MGNLGVAVPVVRRSADLSDGIADPSISLVSSLVDASAEKQKASRVASSERRHSHSYLSDADAVARSADASHVRINDGFLARHETPLLTFLASRVPAFISPNHLTLLGLGGAVLVLLGLVLSHLGSAWLLLAVSGLLLNWLGDSLDGTLARYRRIERSRYGFYIDHMTDVGAQALIILGIGLSPYLRFEWACLILIVYMSATIFTLIRLHVDNVLCLAYCGVGPTEARAMLMVGIAVAAVLGAEATIVTPYGVIGLYDLLASLLVISAMLMLFVLVRKHAGRLDAEDPTLP